jgi:succinate semialdehyde reductase
MFSIKQPNHIIIGNNSAYEFQYPDNALLITSKGAKSRDWIKYLNLEKKAIVFDEVENNPSIDTVKKILEKYSDFNFSCVIGLGGGSCLDVAKYVGYKLNKKKILIPTTFGSGSEVTRISVLKVDGKKKSFHDDGLIADVAIEDSYFLKNTPEKIFKDSVIDSCAQATEAYDSKNSNPYTKFLCKIAFEKLEFGVLNNHQESIVLGSLYCGLGFGNSSTTLGHALSYVFSNEGYSHGHALSYTTTLAHKFNSSVFYDRFLNIAKHLKFEKILLQQKIDEASDLILTDTKHLDNNPKSVTKEEIIELLDKINHLNLS